MTRTIGVGVIGMGWMGQVHSRAYNQLRDRFHDSGIVPRLVICRIRWRRGPRKHGSASASRTLLPTGAR